MLVWRTEQRGPSKSSYTSQYLLILLLAGGTIVILQSLFATSAEPKNLAYAPRLSPFRSFEGVAGDETKSIHAGPMVPTKPLKSNEGTTAGADPGIFSPPYF